MKRYFLDTPLGQVHYALAGSGDPLILLHQSPFCLEEYTEVIPLLSQDYGVIALDTPGYGDSEKPLKQPSIEDYAGTVNILMDTLKVEKASIVGHHTGAFIAIEVAASSPERVDKLVLSGPIYTDEAIRENALETFGQPWKIKEDGSHIIDQWNFWKEHDPALPPSLVNKMTTDWLRAGTPYSTWAYNAVFSYHIEERLGLIQCPTLILYGTDDLTTFGFSKEDEAKVGEAIQKSKTVYVEGGTFALAEMMPQVFSRLILAFLKDTSL
jgi:pimeloyl-ACP methyl ester carboxylesterase